MVVIRLVFRMGCLKLWMWGMLFWVSNLWYRKRSERHLGQDKSQSDTMKKQVQWLISIVNSLKCRVTLERIL